MRQHARHARYCRARLPSPSRGWCASPDPCIRRSPGDPHGAETPDALRERVSALQVRVTADTMNAGLFNGFAIGAGACLAHRADRPRRCRRRRSRRSSSTSVSAPELRRFQTNCRVAGNREPGRCCRADPLAISIIAAIMARRGPLPQRSSTSARRKREQFFPQPVITSVAGIQSMCTLLRRVASSAARNAFQSAVIASWWQIRRVSWSGA